MRGEYFASHFFKKNKKNKRFVLNLFCPFRDAALAILSHRDWKAALRNKTFDEDKKLTTPIRKLIKRMPGRYTTLNN